VCQKGEAIRRNERLVDVTHRSKKQKKERKEEKFPDNRGFEATKVTDKRETPQGEGNTNHRSGEIFNRDVVGKHSCASPGGINKAMGITRGINSDVEKIENGSLKPATTGGRKSPPKAEGNHRLCHKSTRSELLVNKKRAGGEGQSARAGSE